MKKVLSLLMVTSILLCLFCGCNTNENEDISPLTDSITETSDKKQNGEDSTINDTEEIEVVNSNTTEKQAVVSNEYGQYYIGGYSTFLLNNDDSVSIVNLEASTNENDASYPTININKSVYDGESIYAQNGDATDRLYKYTFKDNDTLEQHVWIDENTLKNSVVVTENPNKRYTGNMQYWQLDGEYIYFIYMPGPEYLSTEQNIAYRLGRITKDGSSIEFIENEIASTYAVKDEWIYYYDNGFTYDKNESRGYYCNYDRTGIYKMKIDGSQKQLLLNDFETDEKDTRGNITYCDRMNIIDDYIYFIDYSKNGKSRVCRMKTDGSDREYISRNGAYSYTVDIENNKLYYASGEFGMSQIESKTIYEVSISQNTETELFKYGTLGQPEFSYCCNYLYFTTQSYYHPGNNSEKPEVCGMRYELAKKRMESLYGYVETKNIYGEDGFIDGKEVTANYYWDEAAYFSNHY